MGRLKPTRHIAAPPAPPTFDMRTLSSFRSGPVRAGRLRGIVTRHCSTAWLAERGDPQDGSRAPRQLLTQASANVLSSREGADGISLFVHRLSCFAGHVTTMPLRHDLRLPGGTRVLSWHRRTAPGVLCCPLARVPTPEGLIGCPPCRQKWGEFSRLFPGREAAPKALQVLVIARGKKSISRRYHRRSRLACLLHARVVLLGPLKGGQVLCLVGLKGTGIN